MKRQTASFHVSRLVWGDLLPVEPQTPTLPPQPRRESLGTLSALKCSRCNVDGVRPMFSRRLNESSSSPAAATGREMSNAVTTLGCKMARELPITSRQPTGEQSRVIKAQRWGEVIKWEDGKYKISEVERGLMGRRRGGKVGQIKEHVEIDEEKNPNQTPCACLYESINIDQPALGNQR